jgi:amino acid permease
MKLNRSQQDFLRDKLGDFGNLMGTGVLVLASVAEKVGWRPIVIGIVICVACYAYALYLRK